MVDLPRGSDTARLVPVFAGSMADDKTMPLKVPIDVGTTCLGDYLDGCRILPDESQSHHPALLTMSQWTNMVQHIAPSLNAEGLQRAFAIQVRAVGNLQHLQRLAARAQQDFDCMVAIASIHEQQNALYAELIQLTYSAEFQKPPLPPRSPPFGPITPGPTVQQHFQPNTRGPPAPCTDGSTIAAPHPPGKVTTTIPKNAGVNGNNQRSRAQKTPTPATSPQMGPAPAPSGRRKPPQTLSTSLRFLEEQEDPDTLLVVRGISKLGFKAVRSLKQHFASHGTVVRVLLAHSTAIQYGVNEDQGPQVKRRPSNLGFVQVASAEVAQAILAQGPSQNVEGVAVRVQQFTRQRTPSDGGEDEECEEKNEVESKAVPAPAVTNKLLNPPTGTCKVERGMSDISTASSGGSSPVR